MTTIRPSARDAHAMVHGGNYEIRLQGPVGEEVLDDFDAFDSDVGRVETVLHGKVRDQAALHRVLERIDSLGLELVAVRRLPRRDATRERPS
jgi:hypothetical protein